MKEGLFFLFLFNFIPISAQYCCTEIMKLAHIRITFEKIVQSV